MSEYRPAIPSKEELEMIREYCILEKLLETVQKNRSDMEYKDNTLKPLYLKSAERLWENIEEEKRQVKAKLSQIRCKVFELKDRHDPAAIHYEFWLRGYYEEFGIMKMLLRSEIGIRLGQYIAKMFKRPST